jgi:hypothetical protein
VKLTRLANLHSSRFSRRRSKINKLKDPIMTKPIRASEQGLKPTTESGSSFLTRCSPSHRGRAQYRPGFGDGGRRRWINDHQYRDTIGLINVARLADRPPEQGGCVLLLEPRHRRHVPGREVIVPPSGDTLGLTPRKPNPRRSKFMTYWAHCSHR